jgi:hypothetical protein
MGAIFMVGQPAFAADQDSSSDKQIGSATSGAGAGKVRAKMLNPQPLPPGRRLYDASSKDPACGSGGGAGKVRQQDIKGQSKSTNDSKPTKVRHRFDERAPFDLVPPRRSNDVMHTEIVGGEDHQRGNETSRQQQAKDSKTAGLERREVLRHLGAASAILAVAPNSSTRRQPRNQN